MPHPNLVVTFVLSLQTTFFCLVIFFLIARYEALGDPGIEQASPTLAGGLFHHCDAWEAPLLAASDLKDHPAGSYCL